MNNVQRANDWNSKYPQGTAVLVHGKMGRAGRVVPACFNRVFIRVNGILESLRAVTPNSMFGTKSYSER